MFWFVSHRFLPPGSYLNALDTTPTRLAATIVELMNSHQKYTKFFGWKKYYKYKDPSDNDNVCSVCQALNEDSMKKPKYYKQFRSWWLPNFRERCRWYKQRLCHYCNDSSSLNLDLQIERITPRGWELRQYC